VTKTLQATQDEAVREMMKFDDTITEEKALALYSKSGDVNTALNAYYA